MRSNQNQPPKRDPILSSILLQVGTWISSGPVLAALAILIAAAVLTYVLFFSQLQPGLASEIPLPPSASPSSAVSASLPKAAEPTPAPTVTATKLPTQQPLLSSTPNPAPPLPIEAAVEGVQGHKQSMPLSCEARSAVDWAAYFGVEIEEEKFFAGLPSSDDPDQGFVGDVFGSWGQIPPNDYGVHAKPIAQRLREYGLKAKDLRHMTLDELKAEIAAGRPVIVWVVGHVNRGTPEPYRTENGEITTVAKFEHTVIVTAYTEYKITVIDGARSYPIYQGEFLKSWNVLENQAVVWID